MNDELRFLIICDTICNYFDISSRVLHANTNCHKSVKPRRFAYKFLKSNTKLSLADIGWKIAKRDHSTVSLAIKKLDYFIDIYPEYNKIFNDLEFEISKRLSGDIDQLIKLLTGIYYDVYYDKYRIAWHITFKKLELLHRFYPDKNFTVHFFEDSVLKELLTIEDIFNV